VGRHKTISDEDVLAVARSVFRERGHTVSTRDIAKIAGISETVLYQRFGSKEALFFAAMVPGPPDLQKLLGPLDPPGEARLWVRSVVDRMTAYFAEVLPMGIQLMTHPSFKTFATTQPAAAATRLEEELAVRLRRLQQRQQIGAATSVMAAARLLTTLAHDVALRHVLSGKGGAADRRQLAAMVDIVWRGLA
jgi:AcrR family transcriptional regulator